MPNYKDVESDIRRSIIAIGQTIEIHEDNLLTDNKEIQIIDFDSSLKRHIEVEET